VVPSAPKPSLVGGGRIAAIVPQDLESAWRLAQLVHASAMAPKSLDSVEKCAVAIMHGLEVGLTPMAALQSIAVINGTPALWGDGMLALVRGSGLLEDLVETVDHDKDGPTIATCKVKRRGQSTWVIHSFTRPEAVRAGLWRKQGPWQQYPQRMMQMRARNWALRDAFADVLRGLRSAEEVQDMVDVTGAGSATTSPPEPRRRDFMNEAAGDAGGTAHDPETGEVRDDPPRDRPWKLADNIVGEGPRRKAILELLDLAKVKKDVDEIEDEHEEFLGKLGRLKAETMRAFEVRRGELPEELEEQSE
jgi:hypothetical protein